MPLTRANDALLLPRARYLIRATDYDAAAEIRRARMKRTAPNEYYWDGKRSEYEATTRRR